MAKLRRDRGIVLTARDVQETDRLIQVLSEREGKIAILVKRARRMESPYGAILEPTNYVELIYYVRDGPYLLKEASLVRLFSQLRGDAAALEAALMGLAFTAEHLPEGNPEPEVLRLVREFLLELERGLSPRVGLLAFELKLLSLAGHGPHLTGCVRCGGEEGLTWSPDEGLICRTCGGKGNEVPPSLWRGMRMLTRLPLRATGRVKVVKEDLEVALKLLRQFPSSTARTRP